MKKNSIVLFLFILIVGIFYFDNIFAYKPSNPPEVMKDIDIEDEKTGLRIRDYYYLLPDGKFNRDIAKENGWIDIANNTLNQKSLAPIQKLAKENIELKVTELKSGDDDYNKLLEKVNNELKERNEKLEIGTVELEKDSKNNNEPLISAYKIEINKKNFDKFWVEKLTNPEIPKCQLVIPLRYRNKDGEQKNPHYEHNIIIYKFSKVAGEDFITPVETSIAQTYMNIPYRGEDDIIVNDVRPGDYIFIATGKLTKVPENMLPGTYKTNIDLRHNTQKGAYSMGQPAIKHEAKIEVDKFGNKTLYLEAQPMELSGVRGHLLRLWYKYGDKKYLAETIGTYTDKSDGHNYPKVFKIPIYNNQPIIEVDLDADAMNKPESGFVGIQTAQIAINVDVFNGEAGLILKELKLAKDETFECGQINVENEDILSDNAKLKNTYGKIKIISKGNNLVDIKLENAKEYITDDDKNIYGKIKDGNEIKDKFYKVELINPKEVEVFSSKGNTSEGKQKISNNFIIKDVDLSKIKGTGIGEIIKYTKLYINDTKKNKIVEEKSFRINGHKIHRINYYNAKSLNEKLILNKKELEEKIKEANNIKQGNKSNEDFNKLRDTISLVEGISVTATTQEQIDNAKLELENAIKNFNALENQEPQVDPNAEKTYELPVYLKHGFEERRSMGAGALEEKAKVTIKGNTATIDLHFKGISVAGLYGHLTDLFIFENNNRYGHTIKTSVVENTTDTDLNKEQRSFPKIVRFTMDKDKFMADAKSGIYVNVWVDAMDSLDAKNQSNGKFIGYDKYTKGVGQQTARLVFDTSKITSGGSTLEPDNPSNPSNPSTPGYSFQNLAIERSALGSAMASASASMSKGADSNLVAAMARAGAIANNPYASREEILSATQALNNAVINNKGSMNNQNNNNSWGNNNQGWGNNSGWGNNNSSWGSYGNNNQGWNNNSSWGVYNNQNNNKNNGPVTIQYEVPVEVLHAYQDGYSMANGAINHIARVEERNGQFRYSVQFNPLEREFNGQKLVGNLTHLFIHDGNKYLAEQSSGNVWSWVMNGKYNRVNISVKVDVMDQIAVNEQKAILSFNWNNAREVGRVGGNNNNQNQQNQNQQNQQNQQKQAPQVVQNNSASNNFTDTSGHWAKTAIDYVVSKGYFAGLSNTEFGPNKSITRGQFVSVLGRMLKVNVNDYKDQNFKDVKSGMYYSPYITWANKVGIVSGVGQGKFAPDKELTREEMAVMMTKFLKVSGKNLNAKGNTNGFKDEEKIQSWAKDSVKEMARLGIVSGMGDGSFAPKSQFTRAQVAQVLYNIDHN